MTTLLQQVSAPLTNMTVLPHQLSAPPTNLLRHRRPGRADGLQNLWDIPFSISSENGPQLQNTILEELARALSSLDQFVLSLWSRIYKGRKDTQNLSVVNKYLDQIKRCHDGEQHFSAGYLKSKELQKYWEQIRDGYLSMWKDPSFSAVRGDGGSENLEELDFVEQEVQRLTGLVLVAVNSGLLSWEERLRIQSRWCDFDIIMQGYHSRLQTERTSLSWPQIASQFSEGDIKVENEGIKMDWISTSMWLTFSIMVIVSLPTFALAVQLSPHAPGTTLDADFWFLIQACSMQILGLLIVGIPMWKGKALSGQGWYWTWACIGLATGCTIAAPLVYCKLRTEWSSFLVIVAGATQAFVTLQVTLIADLGPHITER